MWGWYLNQILVLFLINMPIQVLDTFHLNQLRTGQLVTALINYFPNVSSLAVF